MTFPSYIHCRAARGRAVASLLFTLCLLMAASAHGFAQVTGKIADITVQGNKNINRESIISASGLKVGDTLTQASINDARTRLMQTGNFGSHTFDRPDESVIVNAEITDGVAHVIIKVDENDVVNSIQIEGAGPIPTAKVLEVIQTKTERVLNINILLADWQRIKKLYDAKGYQAVVTDELDIKNGVLRFPIKVAVISKITITGLKKTKRWVVLREMRQKEGSYYNQADLSADLRRIIDTQFFDDVVPGIGLPGVGKVDVTLTITERRTGNVSVGVGYGNRQQLVGRAEIGDNNFGGTGQSVSLLGETGGVANRSSLELGFTQPWIDNKHTSLSVSLFDKTVYRFSQSIGSLTGTTTGTATTYFETHTGGQFTVGRPFSKVYQGFLGVRFENIRVPALDLNANDAGILQNGPLQTITLRAIRSTRDFIQDPAVGAFDTFTGDIGRADVRPITLTNGQTPIGTFGNLNWFKYGLDTRRYFSPQGKRINIREKRNVFALRLMAATTSGTTPFSEQYFVGGAESLRGYREDRFWGKQMVLGSFEYRAPLAEALTGVLFVDAGDAWGGNYTNVSFNGFTQHSNFSPNLGAGLGIRVRTPIGPIRFDYGFGREGGRLHFSIGNVF